MCIFASKSCNFNIDIDMPTINFKKLFREKADKAFIEKAQIIAPTIFDIPVNEKEVMYNTELQNNSVITVVDKTYTSSPFVRISDRIYFHLYNLNGSDIRLVLYIISLLKFNSNIIEIDKQKAAKAIGLTENTLRNTISNVIKANILVATDEDNIFVINHNIIFKGDYNEFIKNYIGLYDALPAEKDGFGRIKLKEIRKAEKAIQVNI